MREAAGALTIEATKDLTLKGKSVRIEAQTSAEVRAGTQATLKGNAGATLDGGAGATVQGAMISIKGNTSFSP